MKKTSIESSLARARTLSGHTVVRPSDAAAVLGITGEDLDTILRMPGCPGKVVRCKRAVGWRIADLKVLISNMTERGVS